MAKFPSDARITFQSGNLIKICKIFTVIINFFYKLHIITDKSTSNIYPGDGVTIDGKCKGALEQQATHGEYEEFEQGATPGVALLSVPQWPPLRTEPVAAWNRKWWKSSINYHRNPKILG